MSDTPNTAPNIPAGWRVKPLEWSESRIIVWNGDYHTVPTGYTIRCADENGWKWSYNGGFGYAFSPELAQAAAQSDYERRILSALERDPACPHCGTTCGGSNGWCADMEAAPRDRTMVFARCRDNDRSDFSGRVFCVFCVEHEGDDWSLFPGYGVTSRAFSHWQPLPTPPKEAPSHE